MILDLIRSLFKGKPKTAQACYNLAYDLFQEGACEKALKVLARGETLNPNLPEIYYGKGLCLEKLGEYESAKESLKHALSLSPEDPDCLYNLARIYYTENDLGVALAYAEQASNLVEEPGDEAISYLLGLIYEQMGKIEEAIRYYEQSLAINPEQTLVGIFLGKLYVQQGNYEKAIEILRNLAEQDPQNLDINYELSLCLAKINDWDEAVRYCKRVIEIDPNYKKGYNQLGLAMYCTDHYKEAMENYQKALELDPNYATAVNNLAYTYEKMEKYPEAIGQFEKYLEFTTNTNEIAEIKEHIELLNRKMLEEQDLLPDTPQTAVSSPAPPPIEIEIGETVDSQ